MSEEPPRLLLAGQIGKPHGTSGEVYVVRISDDPQRFQRGARLIHASERVLTVESSRPHRTRFLVKFEDIDDRDAAEELRGALYVEQEALRELRPDEYWEHDLVGCRAVDAEGRELGRIESLIPGAAQDLLSLETPRGERLVPVVKDIVIEVDLGDRRVTLDPPPGLLD